jgi:high-affinity Fe2+/Pb2+ permease
MNFLWDNVFEYFKERRYGAIFFSALVAFLMVFFIGAVVIKLIIDNGFQDYLFFAVSVMGMLFLFWIAQGIARLRRRRWDRYKSSPLSRDELSKARSKLRTKQSFKKL